MHSLEPRISKKILISSPYNHVEQYLREVLGTDLIQCQRTKGKGDISRLVMEEVAADYNFIAMAVGDTSAQEVWNTPGLDLKKLIFLLIYSGTANNGAGNNRIRKGCRTSHEFIKQILLGELDPTEYIIPTDLIKTTYNDGEQILTDTAVSFGLPALACRKAEKNAQNSLLRRVLSKKVNYASGTLRAINKIKKHPLVEAEIEYFLADGTRKSVHLKDILAITLANCAYFGGMKNWNSNGCAYDGKLESIVFKDRNFFKILELVRHMTFSFSDAHLMSENGNDGFNRYGVHHMNNIIAAEVRMSGENKEVLQTLESGGATYHINNPGSVVRVDVKQGATNLVYLPIKSPRHETFTTWR